MKEDGSSVRKTCGCTSIAFDGVGDEECRALATRVQADGDKLFGNGPECSGLVELFQHPVTGWGLKAKKVIAAGTIVGAARCDIPNTPCFLFLHSQI